MAQDGGAAGRRGQASLQGPPAHVPACLRFSSLPTRAPTRAPCRGTSAIETSSTPCATPKCRPRASRTFGATDADCPICQESLLTKRIRWFEDSTGSPSFNHWWMICGSELIVCTHCILRLCRKSQFRESFSRVAVGVMQSHAAEAEYASLGRRDQSGRSVALPDPLGREVLVKRLGHSRRAGNALPGHARLRPKDCVQSAIGFISANG
jgi:hypothetical protein